MVAVAAASVIVMAADCTSCRKTIAGHAQSLVAFPLLPRC